MIKPFEIVEVKHRSIREYELNTHTATTSLTSLPLSLSLPPQVPGINIPMKELPYYFATLLMASVIHEAGHAFAAVQYVLLFLFMQVGNLAKTNKNCETKMPT